MISLRERFEEMNVPCPDELPGDMADMVMNGLSAGRVLCIVQTRDPDGVTRNTWSFLNGRLKDDN